MNIRIATRKSELALWQANHVADRLRALPDVAAVTLVPLSTRGDEILDRSLQKIGGKGLFIKELEVAMQEDRADIAVHSMKDVPVDMPEGFCLAASLTRANPADCLVTPGGTQLSELPHGATIGSSSLRRQAQLKRLRADLIVKPLRGNINTRLQKLENGEFDGIILAAAGLERLGLDAHISHCFTPDEMLPAAAQGVLGLECRADRQALRELLAALNDDAAVHTTHAERAIARALQASCQSPVAAYATVDDQTLTLRALVAHPDGSRVIAGTLSGDTSNAEALGEGLAAQLIADGAADLLRDIETYLE